MSESNRIPELDLKKPDGSFFNRLEMEQQIRTRLPAVYDWRATANKPWNLDRKESLSMKPISILHWMLDEMIRRRVITGDILGVVVGVDDNPKDFTEFMQKLAYFVQSGQATEPREGEGINMSEIGKFVPPGAPPPNGQPTTPQFTPPQGFPPPAPAFQPAQQQQPQFSQFQPPQMQAPAPQFQPSMPPQFTQAPGMQMAQPPQPQFSPVPPPGMQMTPPAPPAPPQVTSRKKRSKADPEGAPIEAAPAGMPQFAPGPQAMPQFAPNPGAIPQFQAGPVQPPVQAAPEIDRLARLEAKVEEVLKVVSKIVGDTETLKQKVSRVVFLNEMGDVVNSIAVRPFMGKQMPTDPKQLGCETTFKECGLPVPTK